MISKVGGNEISEAFTAAERTALRIHLLNRV